MMQAATHDFASVAQGLLNQIDQQTAHQTNADVKAAILHQTSMIRDRLRDMQSGTMSAAQAVSMINESLVDIANYNDHGGSNPVPYGVAAQTGACVAGLQWLTANSQM